MSPTATPTPSGVSKSFPTPNSKSTASTKSSAYVRFIFIIVGRGAIASVVAARDKGIGTPNHEFVAIKKIETNRFDCKLFAKGIIRELKLLRLLKH